MSCGTTSSHVSADQNTDLADLPTGGEAVAKRCMRASMRAAVGWSDIDHLRN